MKNCISKNNNRYKFEIKNYINNFFSLYGGEYFQFLFYNVKNNFFLTVLKKSFSFKRQERDALCLQLRKLKKSPQEEKVLTLSA